MNAGRGMIMFRVGMLHEVGSSAMMMLFVDNSVAMSETLRPSGNWPAEQEEETKQREEEALHTALFRCGLSLTDDETRFKSFDPGPEPSVGTGFQRRLQILVKPVLHVMTEDLTASTISNIRFLAALNERTHLVSVRPARFASR